MTPFTYKNIPCPFTNTSLTNVIIWALGQKACWWFKVWSFPAATFIVNSGFQCLVPGMTDCLSVPGTFLVSAMKFPSLRKPLSPGKLGNVAYPNWTEKTLKNDNLGRLVQLPSQIAVLSWRFFCLSSHIPVLDNPRSPLSPARPACLPRPPQPAGQIP